MFLTDFTSAIRRPKGGFRWIRRADLVLISDRDGADYDPLREVEGLFRDFAKLQPDEAVVLSFAESYGDLLRTGPTTLKFWKDSIERLAYGVGLWEGILAYRESGRKDASCLAPYIRWEKGEITAVRWLMVRRGEYKQGELWQPANDVLFSLLNWQMAPLWENQPNRQVATLEILPDSEHTLDFKVCITNLIDVLWLQFAFAVRGDERFGECKRCGRSFKLKGKRTDRLFCSNSCRVLSHRERWNRVAELHRLGRGLKQISTEVGLPQKAIKAWLQEHQ